MTKPAFKTISEQRVEWLESLRRPLTDAESEDLRRSMHAVYERGRRSNALAMSRTEELKLLEKLRAEAASPERCPER